MTTKITNPQDLNAMRDRARGDIELRTGGQEVRMTVHMGTCGIAAGARDVLAALAAELGGAGARQVSLRQSGCAGLCEQEPMLTLVDAQGRQFRYGKLDAARVREIVRQHVMAGSPVVEFLIRA